MAPIAEACFTASRQLQLRRAFVDFYQFITKARAHVSVGEEGDFLELQWRLNTRSGPIGARSVVVALGPGRTMSRLELVNLPLAVKREFHMHYTAEQGARLRSPLYSEDGFLMSPMAR